MPRKRKPVGPATGYGNGSVYEESPGSGRWMARLDGVRRRARGEEEAQQKLLRLQKQRDDHLQLGEGSQTVSAWYTTWVNVYCDEFKHKTREGYKGVYHCWIKPYAIANIRLDDLRPTHIDKWLETLEVKGIGPASRLIAYRRIRAALKVAVNKEILVRNPADKATQPVLPPTPEREVFSE